MTNDADGALDPAIIRHGDRVDVHGNGHTRCSGYVEDMFPQMNIVWIRELRTGERRMLSTDEYRIYRPQP